MSDDNHTQTSQVSCELLIPMAWNTDYGAARPGEALHMQNIQRLQAIEALESSGHKKTEQPTGPEAEIQRLESKLNLALDLLATLVEQAHPRPLPHTVQLAGSWARWTSLDAVEHDSHGRLALYLHPLLAQPVILPARMQCEPQPHAPDEYRLHCHFDPMPDDVADALLAYVFRGHRRAVAEKRLHSE